MCVCICFNPVCDSLSFLDLWFVSSINFGKFLTTGSSNISSVLFSLFYFWNSNYTQVRLSLLPHSASMLCYVVSCSFGVSVSTPWEENRLFLWSFLSSLQVNFLSTRKPIIKLYLFIWWQLNCLVLCDAITGSYMGKDRNFDFSDIISGRKRHEPNWREKPCPIGQHMGEAAWDGYPNMGLPGFKFFTDPMVLANYLSHIFLIYGGNTAITSYISYALNEEWHVKHLGWPEARVGL